MTLDELRALADEFFVWPEGSGRQTVTTFSALLFAQHVLQLREKSLGTENSAGMDALRNAAQRQLEALAAYRREIGLLTGVPDEQPCDAEVALRAALEQDEKPVAKIRTWHKGGEQNAELWGWDDGIETLPDGEHLLYASAPLRAALEQAEPVEPVAHRVVAGALFDFMGWLTSRRERLVLSSTDDAAPAADAIKDFAEMRDLSLDDAKVQDWNTAPPQRKPLTEKEIDKISWTEPVAWMCPEDPERETAFNWKAGHCENCGKKRIPLYTAPPQRKPLTDEEIEKLFGGAVADVPRAHWLRQAAIEVVRKTERAHGIGEGV